LGSLKKSLNREKLLGALMFSCGARGPQPRMLPVAMADATEFRRVFPDLPLHGFYAGGEIGPEARAANGRVFMHGRVKLQGFTAVFGVFVVPRVQLRDYHITAAEDTLETCQAYAQKKVAVEA
jgi:small ligand-binding sensory domain FIST